MRDAKGILYTEALAVAIPHLEGQVRKQAREALAERLSRMTSATLGLKLEDDDTEVRRAAALAVAMKEDKASCRPADRSAGRPAKDSEPGGARQLEEPQRRGFRTRRRGGPGGEQEGGGGVAGLVAGEGEPVR